MAISVDNSSARAVLAECWETRVFIDDDLGRTISCIINGDHLTYRYILVNALLAKATNGEINALALQAKAPVNGSYDARSLCHKVLVPFDKQEMSSGLGGSNEPFLNKPARFEMLSKTNAVRNGKDRSTLETLISLLPLITNSDDARKYLRSALFDVAKCAENKERLFKFERDESDDVMSILDLIGRLSCNSKEGVIPVLIVTALEKLLYRENINVSVQPHKVNQSGSSSKEIGDIDIYNDGNFVTAIEVKDKDFAEADVEHAIIKSLHSGVKKCMFVYGVHANYDKESVHRLLDHWNSEGIMCVLIPIIPYSRLMIFSILQINRDIFIETVMSVAREINCTPDVLTYIQETISET